MKIVALILLYTCTLTTSIAFGASSKREQFTNLAHSNIKLTVLDRQDYVPTAIRFSNGNQIISFASVTTNNDDIDLMIGDTYDVTGPQTPDNPCNLRAKLSLTEDGFRISFDPIDMDNKFYKNCPQVAAVAGVYKK